MFLDAPKLDPRADPEALVKQLEEQLMASLATENSEPFHSGNGQIELPSDDEIAPMPVTALRELITCARLTAIGCVEKPELRARAMRAVVKLRAERQAAMVAFFQDPAFFSSWRQPPVP